MDMIPGILALLVVLLGAEAWRSGWFKKKKKPEDSDEDIYGQ